MSIRPAPFGRSGKPLRCYRCGNRDRDRLTVSDTVALRRLYYNGRRVTDGPVLMESTRVTCLDCGHQWPSSNRRAVGRRNATVSF